MANTFFQLDSANTSGDYLTIKKAKAMALTNTNRKKRNNFENNLLHSKGVMESHPKNNCTKRGIMINKDLIEDTYTYTAGDRITFLGGYSHLGTRLITGAVDQNDGTTKLTYNPPLLVGTDAGTPYVINRAHIFPYLKVSIDRENDGKLTF